MATNEVVIDVRADTAKARQGLQGLQTRMRNFATGAGEVGRALIGLSAPIVAIGGLSIKAALDFESAYAGVRKTVDATEEQFKELSEGFREMATQIPVNVVELSRIGEAAGQLGIRVENIEMFTRVMADLGVTTNMSSEQAATALARLANITGLPQEQVGRLGATIVELGNNLATTEGEIMTFGLRLAGAGKVAGLSEAQILAIGGAMSSVGVQAQAGGTAVQKVLLAMTEQVSTSGDQLQTFASVAGMSAEQFATAFKEDAGGAFASFVEGLGAAGTDAFGILEELGLQDQRLMRSFLSLAGAGDLLRESMAMGTQAFAENTALTEEAQKRYETAAAQFAIFKNQVQGVAITLGTALIPPMLEILDAIKPIVSSIGEWIENNSRLATALVAFAGVIATLGAALVGVSLILPGLIALAPAMGAAFTLMLGPVGYITLAITGLIAVGVLLWKNWDTIKEKAAELWNGIVGIIESSVNRAIGFFEDMANGVIGFINGLMDKLRPFAKAIGIDLPQAFEELEIATVDLSGIVADVGQTIQGTHGILGGYEKTLQDTAEAAGNMADATRDTSEAARESTKATDEMSASYAELMGSIDDASDSLGELARQYAPEIAEGLMNQDDLLQILSDRWAEQAQAATESVKTIDELMGEEVMNLKDKLDEQDKLYREFAEDQKRIAKEIADAKEEEEKRLTLAMVDWNARKIEAQMAARPKGIQMAIDLGSMLGVDPLAVAGRFGGVMKTGIGAFKVALDEVRRFFPEADWKQLLALSQQLALQRFEASKQRLGLSPEFLESQGIPSFASGGLVNRPTLAMIGERGPEAVVPLNRGGVVTININGPVYGINDLEDKVAEAWLNVYRNGGFQGVVE